MRGIKKFIIVGSLLFCITLQAQNKKIQIAQEPLWITINAVNYDDNQLDHEAEEGYIDLVYEKQVCLEQESIYYKKSIKIISEAGVQNSSEISIGFDPSYKSLIFHSIKIIRDKKSLNRLQTEKIKIIQQEAELDRHIYNNALSAILLLEDVRKGDIIEYSYTLKGFNTIFKGKYADMYETAFSVPVCSLYYKIIVPSNRTITIKNSQTNIQPNIKKLDNATIYEWKQNNVSAFRVQDNLPEWYDPYPTIMLSEYKSWKEVNDWAMKLFPTIKKLSPALQKEINDIYSKDTSVEKRILAALRFVQDDVRYMGIEMGENSHKPFSPDKVLTQRFGDCKDKSYLLCSILRALDIEANPVLINTEYKKTITKWLPTPTAFDHVTVQVKFKNTSFFFDPTISYQKGSMNDISYPDYQCGLIISDSTLGLTEIPLREKGMVKVKEIFNIPDMSGTAKLKVITVYSGFCADDIRYSFNNNSRYEMLKQFRDYYAFYFEKIKEDSLNFEDDDIAGTFTTQEHYTISDLWKSEDGEKKIQFEPFVINGILQKPTDIDRNMPFSIRFPAWYKEDIEINLPEEWDADESSKKIDCENFFMKANFSYFDKGFSLQYEYRSYKDNVSPSETPHFLDCYDRIDKTLAYHVAWTDSNKTSAKALNNVNVRANIVFSILTIIVIVGWLYGGCEEKDSYFSVLKM